MKKLLYVCISVMMIVLIQGCVSSKLATRISVEIGKGFLSSRDLGVVELRKLVKSWPYVSGQIKAIPHYNEEVPGAAQNVIKELDSIANKTEELTEEECGKLSTNFILIEYYAGKFAWDEYGVTITQWARTALGI